MKRINLVFFCFFTFALYSQSDYRDGFVLTNDNDTINGLVNYKESHGQYTICKFKKTKKSKPIEYSTNDIKAYWFVNDKYFISKPIKTDEKVENKFLEYLVKGKASLYASREDYYVQIGDGSLNLLENEKVEVHIENKTYHKNSNRYIATLNYLLRDCEEIKDKIEIFNLNEKQLTKLIEKYNACFEEESVSFKKNKKWVELRTSIQLGLAMSSMNYSISTSEWVTSKFPISYSITGGANSDIYFPRINERGFFNLGVYYQKTSFEGSHSAEYKYWSSMNDTSVQAYSTAEFSQIKVPFGFGYRFPEKKITPIIRIGALLNFVLDSSSYSRIAVQRNGRSWLEELEDPFKFHKTQVGIWTGLGLEKNLTSKLSGSIDIRYEYIPIPTQREEIVEGASYSNLLIMIAINI